MSCRTGQTLAPTRTRFAPEPFFGYFERTMTLRSRIVRPLAICLIPVIALIAAGCKTTPKAEPMMSAPPPSAEVFNELKARLTAGSPDARVGKITEVLASESLARVSDVPVADFPVSGGVVILDATGTKVATAIVDRIDNDTVVVKYSDSSRAPEVGDVALRFVK